MFKNINSKLDILLIVSLCILLVKCFAELFLALRCMVLNLEIYNISSLTTVMFLSIYVLNDVLYVKNKKNGD